MTIGASPLIRTRQAVGAHKAKWRAEYRFSPDEPWRPVCGPGMRRLGFTTQQGAVHAARYHAAKWEDGR